VVLGASSPYGAATVRVLAREGVNVALGGRDRERLEGLEAEIHASGGQALVVGTHLAKRHHPAHLVEAAVDAFGGLDFLLFMARASAPPLASLDVDAWERSVDVNLKGFIYCLAAALPAMREGGGGHVLVLGIEDPADPLHGASRAAVRVLLEGLEGELSGEGLRASELTVFDPGSSSPERCAEAVLRALSSSPEGFSSEVV
jgi:NADP-dependent 3-hydroxy acid dehydrogenase YdfG